MQCQIDDLCKSYDVRLCLLIPKVKVITQLKTLLDKCLKGFFVFIFRIIGIFQSQKIKKGLERIQFKT